MARDFSGTIARLGETEPLVVTRRAAGTTTKGRYTPGAESTFEIVASIQPASGRAVKMLPEGLRTEETRMLWTTTELIGEGDLPDRVAYKGATWQVVTLTDWENAANYFSYALVKVES